MSRGTPSHFKVDIFENQELRYGFLFTNPGGNISNEIRETVFNISPEASDYSVKPLSLHQVAQLRRDEFFGRLIGTAWMYTDRIIEPSTQLEEAI